MLARGLRLQHEGDGQVVIASAGGVGPSFERSPAFQPSGKGLKTMGARSQRRAATAFCSAVLYLPRGNGAIL
jgi:hypothetical protein